MLDPLKKLFSFPEPKPGHVYFFTDPRTNTPLGFGPDPEKRQFPVFFSAKDMHEGRTFIFSNHLLPQSYLLLVTTVEEKELVAALYFHWDEEKAKRICLIQR